MDDLDELVDSWLAVPEVADLIGTDAGRVRRMLQDRQLVGLRRGEPRTLQVPAALLKDDQPLSELRGTLVVLADAGYSDEEALRWLFSPDDTLPGSPVDALREGRKTEVRRRAQALAF